VPAIYSFVLKRKFPDNRKNKSLNYKSLSIAVILLFVFGCHHSKIVQTDAIVPVSNEEVMNRLVSNQVNANWFSAKVKTSFGDGSFFETFSGNLRMLRDSIIWMNLTKFSLEGARIKITPDSFYMIDRINSKVYVKPFEYLHNSYNLPVTFNALQAIVLGNPFFLSKVFTSKTDSLRYLLTQKTERFEANYWLDPVKFRLLEFQLSEMQRQQKLKIESSDYRKLKGKQKFSYFRTLNLFSRETGDLKLEIEFSNVEIDVPKNMDFNIPPKYEVVY
jgi:hypothetical protein